MGEASQGPADLVALPQGGGALRGIGETFTVDPHTGTGSYRIPIQVPAGRIGVAADLALEYSSAFGNDMFGQGWKIGASGVARSTAHGYPTFNDEVDRFVLGGGEELVPVGPAPEGGVLYRPRTEGMFAHIVHHRDPAADRDVWTMTGTDGRTSVFGTEPAGVPGQDPATIADPDDRARIQGWLLTRITDPLGNGVDFTYAADGHRPWLRRIGYVDQPDGSPYATVTFDVEPRTDPITSWATGFEIRTTLRCTAITTAVHPGAEVPVRRYELHYDTDPYTGTSLLAKLEVVGFDDEGVESRDLPPVRFGYSTLDLGRRRFRPWGGAEPPLGPLSDPGVELIDLTGTGGLDVLESGPVLRYWRNRMDGTFDRSRPVPGPVPAGVALGTPGTCMLDADGDGYADLQMTTPGSSGYYPLLSRSDGPAFGRFRPHRGAGTPALGDPHVKLVDLDRDGVTDALQSGDRLLCWFNDPVEGWRGPRPVRLPDGDGGPVGPIDLADPTVRLADMIGDGGTALVVLRGREVSYWPQCGPGRFGRRVRMREVPDLPLGTPPERLQLADVTGNGAADLLLVEADGVRIWVNRSGEGWSEPVVLRGMPTGQWDVRVADVTGSGVGAVVCSRPTRGDGQPSTFVLELSDDARPGLLTRIDNRLGAVTTLTYSSSAVEAARDHADPRTRWRTRLPVPVAVVSGLRSEDLVSKTVSSTGYRYRDGLLDGPRREFRGFAEVHQTDVDTRLGTPLGPPLETTTWFHVGPVDTGDGGWTQLDLADRHWSGDRQLLGHDAGVRTFLAGEPTADRRDAVRALRGRPLRSEVRTLDGATAPWSVTEYAYTLRRETAHGEPAVYAVFGTAARSTRWERGDDPMTTVSFTDGHDDVGRPTRRTSVAPPRRSARRMAVTAAGQGPVLPDTAVVLATHVRTRWAEDVQGTGIRDRVAEERHIELADPPPVAEPHPDDLADLLAAQYRAALAVHGTFVAPDPGEVTLTGHVVHHYDGEAFVGLEPGVLGRHGLISRTEALVHTDATLDAAFGDRRPDYLGGSAPLPAGAPAGFGASLGHRAVAADEWHVDGWYADTARHGYDVQLTAGGAGRGLPVAARDPLGGETSTAYDEYRLHPVAVTDPLGLTTTVVPNRRVGSPASTVDPNGTETHIGYHPLGMVSHIYRAGTDGRHGTPERPEQRHEYDLAAFHDHGDPISSRTVRRVHYASAGVSDEVLDSWEYSDGFGRVVQQRARADGLAFGATGEEAGLLVPDIGGTPRPVPGRAGGPAVGHRDPDRYVVSGWQVYDDRGRVIEKYAPFLSTGAGYEPGSPQGRPVRMSYDPAGRLAEVYNPDGSRRHVVSGEPAVLTDPGSVVPSPWTSTEYDENDLAPLSTAPDGTSLADRVPAEQHFTPATVVYDALGRVVAQLRRGATGTAPYVTSTRFDQRGNVVAVLDELGREATTHAYDLLGRVVATSTLDGGWRMGVVDVAGDLRHARDARGAQSLRRHDVGRRLVELLACDRAGEPLTVREQVRHGDTDQDRAAALAARSLGRVADHLDEAGRVTIEDRDLTGTPTAQARRTVSDAAIAAAEAGGGWRADWAVVDPDTVLDPPDRITTRYDALGRTVAATLPADVTGHRAELVPAHGRSGALESVRLDGTEHVRLVARNARGQRVLSVLGNGLLTRCAYDPETFRLVRLRTEPAARTGDVWTSTGLPLQDLTYRYDLIGNLVMIEERTPGCGVARSRHGRNRLVRTFAYDGFSRLVSATGRECAALAALRPPDDTVACGAYAAPCAAPPAAPNQANAPDVTSRYEERYAYDVVGTVLDLHHLGRGGVSWHRAFGVGGRPPDDPEGAVDNRLTSMITGTTTTSFGHDDAGNLTTQDDSRAYVWDHAGRLVGFGVTAGSGVSVSARYLYGADGRRVKKWVRRGGAAAQDRGTCYVGGLFERHTWAGGANTWTHVLDDTTRVARVRSGPADPDDAGPPVRYELGDHLGSAALVVDASGGWINREEFYPYGETSFGGYARKRYRFAGREHDESGWVDHGGRYHAPGLLRFTSCDPVLPTGTPGRPYSYCDGRPLVAVDPGGRNPVVAIGGIAILIFSLENTANAPENGKDVQPSMGEGEIIFKTATMVLAGKAAGWMESLASKFLGASLLGRLTAGALSGALSGAGAGMALRFTEDRAHGRQSSLGDYVRSALHGAAIGAFFGAVAGAASRKSEGGAAGPKGVYIPRSPNGEPIPLERQWSSPKQAGAKDGRDVPRPDPRAGDAPHTVLGGKVSSETGEVYRQSATFTEFGNQTKMRGYSSDGQILPRAEPVPVGEVHWGAHGRPDVHPDPHIHGYGATGSPGRPDVQRVDPAKGLPY